MFFPATRRARTMIALAVTIGTAGSASAQNSQPPATIPGLDGFSLPTQPVRPTPVPTPEPRIAPLPRPTPSATAVPSATPSPVAVVPPPVRPTVQAKPTPAATPSARPTVSAEPVPVVTPVRPPVPATTPIPQASPSPAVVEATPTAPAESTGWGSPWLWAIGGALVATCGGIVLYRRRRGADEVPIEEETAAPPSPVPTPLPPVVDAVPAPRARVTIALEVKRAGTNLLSAAVEYRIILHNAGEVDARAIALDLRLFGVEPALERTLDALFAAPIERAVVARFDLAAGATAALEGTAMLPRDVMPPLAIQGIGEGRALFVPVMTVALDYGWGGGSGCSAASFVVGLDRGADAKLGPFRLDGAPRMHDRVRHLPFTVSRAD